MVRLKKKKNIKIKYKQKMEHSQNHTSKDGGRILFNGILDCNKTDLNVNGFGFKSINSRKILDLFNSYLSTLSL